MKNSLPRFEVLLKPIVPEPPELPRYETEGAAGADVRACGGWCIPSGEWKLIPTGYRVEVPKGCRLEVWPRSGLAARLGVTVLNSPGLVDEDYRGELKVLLINLGPQTFNVNHGDRIAQLVISPVIRGWFAQADQLSDTNRGEGGFGSTGV